MSSPRLFGSGSALLALALMVPTLLACGGGSKGRGYPAPKAEDLVAKVTARNAEARNVTAESRMEYWTNGERIKPTVLVMAERGAKVRFNALSPAGGDVMADLACNGSDYQFVDFEKNCYRTGPCTRSTIANLMRVELEPDDFLDLAIGSTPLLPDAKASVSWDSKNRREKVQLISESTGWKQELVFSGNEGTWDLLSSKMYDEEGELEWSIANREFEKVETEDGKALRMPSRTRFEQPRAKAELTVRWEQRFVNTELNADKFTMDIPMGLQLCP